ncbi:EscU/YscU/HrcU family type III secretion system export apparatus switch protein [Porticoccus sp.]|uniref:EscU/YscU/HrcU family type III secretion system export apparatus switch protein n=1 Tax=Porticoccus sp. TaxID=2024853 RepID=UPI000C4590D2|nr:EscU/YscU/HrcU family type III secretion system export apparatus switch protein [Porticoccus sp.]MAZ70609.1 flagellar biosynthesis protein FlhB [Porticoccus sp.]|tara:strand:- start:143 stop:430 length:288 start_codon:yes stop_codon:yes gene_type:complete
MTISKKTDRSISKAAALTYSGTGAPTVVAKGEGFIAKQIIDVADQYEVPLISDEQLVSVLINVPLGDEIPENLYLAIAEVLAHVYRLNGLIDTYD